MLDMAQSPTGHQPSQQQTQNTTRPNMNNMAQSFGVRNGRDRVDTNDNVSCGLLIEIVLSVLIEQVYSKNRYLKFVNNTKPSLKIVN